MNNFGFVVISPDHNIGCVQTTVNSIINSKICAPTVCVVGEDTDDNEMDMLKSMCPTFRGRNTITSLINTGLKYGVDGWNIIVMEGTHVSTEAVKKLLRFARSENDVVYPIVVEQYNGRIKYMADFTNASLNGLTIHKRTFNKIGDMTDNPLEISKFFWSLTACEKGCQFKGIIGTKMA